EFAAQPLDINAEHRTPNAEPRIQTIRCSMFDVRRSALASSQHNRLSFSQNLHAVLNALRPRGDQQPLQWFIHRLVTEAETSVMHRNERISVELGKCPNRFL